MRKPKSYTDSTESAELRARLKELSKLLLSLHKQLIDAGRDDYVSIHGPIDNPYALLQLLTGDPFFAWLRPLSEIIVRIDELVDIELDMGDVTAALESLEQLVDGRVSNDFGPKYFEYVQRIPEVASQHGSVRDAIRKLVPAS